jgi:4-carboxymuconolactone decarboxylase
MPRLPALEFEKLAPDQQKLWQEIGATRNGSPGGPFLVWMHHPQIAERAHYFGHALRIEGKLPRNLFELASLVVARHWSAQYVFTTHARYAKEQGIGDDVIDAIRTHRTPVFQKPDEKLVYDTVRELLATKRLAAETYERALATLGLQNLIELVSTVGFYMTAAALVNAFDVPPRQEGNRLI